MTETLDHDVRRAVATAAAHYANTLATEGPGSEALRQAHTAVRNEVRRAGLATMLDVVNLVESAAVAGRDQGLAAAAPMVTRTGRVLTDADIEALAAEAEAGYDVTPDAAVADAHDRPSWASVWAPINQANEANRAIDDVPATENTENQSDG
jgi:hypothetical protein